MDHTSPAPDELQTQSMDIPIQRAEQQQHARAHTRNSNNRRKSEKRSEEITEALHAQPEAQSVNPATIKQRCGAGMLITRHPPGSALSVMTQEATRTTYNTCLSAFVGLSDTKQQKTAQQNRKTEKQNHQNQKQKQTNEEISGR